LNHNGTTIAILKPMKRYILISLFLISFVASRSQSFQRGTVVFDLNTGFEFYKTTLDYKNDTTIKSQAGNVGLSLGAEVGLGKRIGIGLRGKANSFASDVDAVSREEVNLKSTDLLFMFQLHPLVRNKIDLVIGTDVGFSGLDFEFVDFNNMVSKGNGGYFSLYVNPRFYFHRFGVNFKVYTPFVTYQYFKTTSDLPSAENDVLNKWRGNGIGVSVGIQVRLF
jgi:hypothetical protein